MEPFLKASDDEAREAKKEAGCFMISDVGPETSLKECTFLTGTRMTMSRFRKLTAEMFTYYPLNMSIEKAEEKVTYDGRRVGPTLAGVVGLDRDERWGITNWKKPGEDKTAKPGALSLWEMGAQSGADILVQRARGCAGLVPSSDQVALSLSKVWPLSLVSKTTGWSLCCEMGTGRAPSQGWGGCSICGKA